METLAALLSNGLTSASFHFL